MDDHKKNYDDLFQLSKKARVLRSVSEILDWDQETYMPHGSHDIRSEQLKLLASLHHEMKTDPFYKQTLEKLIDLKTGKILANSLSEAKKSALLEWKRDYLHDTSLPKEFVETFAQVTSQAVIVWREAKKNNQFSLFSPYLEKIVSLCQKKAEYLGYQDHPYDALVDLYEPGITTKKIEILFDRLKKGLSPILQKILQSSDVNSSFLTGEFLKEKQEKIGKLILEKMGFDWSICRLDLSTHPFSCSCHPHDNRVTSKILPADTMSYLFAVLHEGGHALYEMGLPVEQYGSPLGEAISLGMHECQSRFWETRIGLTKEFWQYFYPILQETFPDTFHNYSLDSFHRAINKVIPSLIRIEADEVTYPMHIILRFEIEKKLIEGSLQVKEIPEIWQEKMQKLLNISPKSDEEGCLQDIHWAMGGFGYFPSYTLGTLYASAIFETFEKEFPDWRHSLAHGDLLFVRDWLKEHIHKYGRQYPSLQLLEKINGKPFSEKPFLDHIQKKYQAIYKFKD